jgi:spermidine synthase
LLANILAIGASSINAALPTVLEEDTHSEYSHILIKKRGDLRMMIFVRDNGVEAIETTMSVKKPYELLEPYSKYMFTSYFFVPKPTKVLVVGLGGGAMVQFLRHYDPDVKIDAVEIDGKLADRFFKTRNDDHTRIITDDAFHYFETDKNQYDVIYMDAFLKPSEKTDATGLPLRMKTAKFYKSLQDKLLPGGVVAVNLNVQPHTADDVAILRDSYDQVYPFRVPTLNIIVVCTNDAKRLTTAELRERGKECDHRFKTSFSFAGLTNSLMPK